MADNELLNEEERRGPGRPKKARNANEIWEKEVVEMVELAQRTRKFASDQLAGLVKDAEGITQIKQRLEVVKVIVPLVGELTKSAKVMLTEMQKEPADTEKGFDLAAFIHQQRS